MASVASTCVLCGWSTRADTEEDTYEDLAEHINAMHDTQQSTAPASHSADENTGRGRGGERTR